MGHRDAACDAAHIPVCIMEIIVGHRGRCSGGCHAAIEIQSVKILGRSRAVIFQNEVTAVPDILDAANNRVCVGIAGALCFAQSAWIVGILCSEQTKIHRRQLVVRSVGISNRCGSTGLGQQISCVVIGVGGCRGSRRARGLFP